MQAAGQELLVEDHRIGTRTKSHCKGFAAAVTSFERECKGGIISLSYLHSCKLIFCSVSKHCKYQALFSIIMENVTSFSRKLCHPTHNQSYLSVEHDVVVKFAIN